MSLIFLPPRPNYTTHPPGVLLLVDVARLGKELAAARSRGQSVVADGVFYGYTIYSACGILFEKEEILCLWFL